MTIDVLAIKTAAAGRWSEILASLTGTPREIFDGKHHPCPQPGCGGTDRFRMIDASTGAALCNQCFAKGGGDGIATLRWLARVDFLEACQLLAGYLGLSESESSHLSVSVDPVEQLAAIKHCSAAALREYGAVADRDTVTFPAYSPDRQQCTLFRIWPAATDKRAKGLFVKGKPAGLFFPLGDQGPRFPVAGEDWIVCEGVKDAAAYQSLGYLACGLNTDHLAAKFAELFRGANAVLMPDRTTDAEAKARQSAGGAGKRSCFRQDWHPPAANRWRQGRRRSRCAQAAPRRTDATARR